MMKETEFLQRVRRESICPNVFGATALILHRIPSSAMSERHVQLSDAIETSLYILEF